MSITPLRLAKPQLLIAAAAGFFSFGAAQAIDLYDSLKTWDKQSQEAKKIREQREGLQPPAEMEPSGRMLTNPEGPQGPIRSDEMRDEQPAKELPASESDDANREELPNDPHKPSP